MDKQRVDYLYQKYLKKSLSSEELEEFKQMILDPELEPLLEDQIETHWNLIAEDDIGRLPEQRLDTIFTKVVDHQQPSKRKIPLWRRFAIVAAVGTLFFGAGLFYFGLKQQPIGEGHVVQHKDIEPGQHGATLTLANGKKIKLSDAANGELVKEAGVLIRKTANGQLIYEIKDAGTEAGKVNTLSTDRGETYQIRLPDGSTAWLNAASSLTYTTGLIREGKRKVMLEGEAYFEISKDKKHPFVVNSKGQEMEVVGTHFNVNSYPDEPAITTTLIEGSLKVNSNNDHRIIRPGQQAVNQGGTITIQEADSENATDWKDGDFYLDRVNFKLAMRKIARWYDIEVVYRTDLPDTLEAGGWIARSNKLSTVLNAIEKSGIAHFSIEGRTLYVSK